MPFYTQVIRFAFLKARQQNFCWEVALHTPLQDRMHNRGYRVAMHFAVERLGPRGEEHLRVVADLRASVDPAGQRLQTPMGGRNLHMSD